MTIESMRISYLGPFTDISFMLDSNVNVFIGPNNCGKSTLLMGLAEAIVFPFTAPERLYRSNRFPKLEIKLSNEKKPHVFELPIPMSDETFNIMENLGYTSYVPALRQSTGFRPTSPISSIKLDEKRMTIRSESEYIATRKGIPEDISRDEYYSDRVIGRLAQKKSKISTKNRKRLEKRRSWIIDPMRMTDETIVSKIVELDYRAYRTGDTRYREAISLIANISSEIMTGYPVTFDHIEEDRFGLYPQYLTIDGVLPLDKLSQGTQSIIQWMAHYILGMAEYYDFPSDLSSKKAVFILDEIDAHMHPAWQLRLIPTLKKNLPNCQFLVSTHSPLILSGLGNGQIQLLQRGKRGKVTVSTNESETFGWSVEEILRWIMGMEDTFDIETTDISERIRKLRHKDKLNSNEKRQLEELKQEIHDRLSNNL